MALDTFNPYLFVSAGEQSNKFLTPTYSGGIASFQAQRAQSLTGLTVRIDPIQEGTGDPSPENIRPISGRTGLAVTVQSGDTQNTYPISWQTEAGTVYGGTLDVVSGVLTVTHGYILLDGTQAIRKNGRTEVSQRAFISIGGKAFGINNIQSDRFSIMSVNDAVGKMIGRPALDGVEFYIPLEGTENTEASCKQWFADNNTQLVYELATPQTYQLSPAEVRTIAGFNQIYSDAGPVIDIKF